MSQKAQKIFKLLSSDNFNGTSISILSSEYNDDKTLLDQLKKRVVTISISARVKIEKIMRAVTITYTPNDDAGKLQFVLI